MNMTTAMERYPRPKKISDNGAQAIGGMAMKRPSSGWTNSRNGRQSPADTPMSTAATTAAPKPPNSRNKLAMTWRPNSPDRIQRTPSAATSHGCGST
ncbi:hypothetical protein [Rhizobium leguminosarum]|uniref:hypothetical protein n=1 Tax=Rhizobium leguminosarum TaxID=384 RepID=UPI0035192000